MKFTRRQFLSAAVTGSALSMLKLASAKELSNTLGGTMNQWEDLRNAIQGKVYLPNDEGFGLKAMVNNLRYMDRLPPAIAIVDSADKAQKAINWCRTNNSTVKFHIKGGGHSYAGFSAVYNEPVLILMTEGMDSYNINPDTGNLTLGAGAINRNVYNILEEHKKSITHGRCPTVGVAGFVLGGGIGFDMRRYGMASDLLRSVEIVLASGEKVLASDKRNKDLFWALRGGAGGNFGLTTAFEFKTHDVSSTQLLVFHKKYQTREQKAMSIFLHHLMSSCQAMPHELGTRISVQYLKEPTGEKFSLDLVGQWAGSKEKLSGFFEDIEKSLPPVNVIEYQGNYWKANCFLEEADESFFYQERSTFIPETPSTVVINQALKHLKNRPDVHGPCDLRFFQMGGEVNKIDKTATAFVHRDSEWLALVGYNWKKRDMINPELMSKGHQWQDDFYKTLLNDFKGKGAFQNFPDISLKNWAEAYYGENLSRLKQVKKKYDPDRLFDFAQAI
ncbi:MAG: FAD-binding oxidoreductase [Candidatus Electrothrix sp. ATG2]|nr:FAD-binding oxidoreductase [Candidatus Electrothrix sp. ATG2]